MVKVVIGLIVAAVVIIGGIFVINPLVNGTTSETTEVSEKNSYTIEGEVALPGTYSLSSTVTLADLIDAAGGTTSNADELAYFETAEISKGSSYYIASKYDASDVCNDTEITKVNVNLDSADVLVTVNGISTSVANSIVSYREENGIYNTIEDLMNVYGIGNATYRKIRNYVILHE